MRKPGSCDSIEMKFNFWTFKQEKVRIRVCILFKTYCRNSSGGKNPCFYLQYVCFQSPRLCSQHSWSQYTSLKLNSNIGKQFTQIYLYLKRKYIYLPKLFRH